MAELRRESAALPSRLVERGTDRALEHLECSIGAMPGSVAITSPAIQPSSAAPAQTSTGSRASSAMINAAPATISGTADGKAEHQQRHAAIGRGGDRDDVVETTSRCRRRPRSAPPATDARPIRRPSSSSCSGTSSFGRDHDQREAADQLQVGQFHQAGDDAGEDDPQQHGSAGAEASCPRAGASVSGRGRRARSPARCRRRAGY